MNTWSTWMCCGCKIAENIENSGAKGLLTVLTCFFSRKQMHVHTREAIRRKALIPICNCFSISNSLFTGPKSGCTLTPVSSSLRAFFSFSLGACGVTQAQAQRGKQTTLTSKLITKHERSRAFSRTSFREIPLHFARALHFYPQTPGDRHQNSSKSPILTQTTQQPPSLNHRPNFSLRLLHRAWCCQKMRYIVFKFLLQRFHQTKVV